MTITIEGEGFDELARALHDAAEKAPVEARKVVAKGAVNIKKEWRRRWSGYPHARALPYAVTYDLTSLGTAVAAEIGPDKAKRQGALGNLLEYGSIHNAPIPGGAPALEAEQPRFVKALEDMAERLIEEAR
jgi:hypothetical protein